MAAGISSTRVYSPQEYSWSVYTPKSETDTKTASAFESVLEFFHSLNEVSRIGSTATSWGGRVSSTADLSNKATARIAAFDMPLTGGLVIADLYDLRKEALSQTPDPYKVSKLWFSLIARVSGFIQMAASASKNVLTEAVTKRLGFVSLIAYLIKDIINLAQELKKFSSYTKILNAAVDLSCTLISLYLLFTASEILLLLLLSLSTASIGLSFLT